MLHHGSPTKNFLARDQADLVILDINLPGLDGLSLLKQMRGRSDSLPMTLLTTRAQPQGRVTGLGAGADDYLI